MVMLNKRLGIAYFGVPKVASSSIKHTLYTLEHGQAFDKAAHGGQHMHNVFPDKISVLPQKMDGLDGYWKFAIVRDPVKRILSCYGNRIIDYGDLRKGRFARTRAMLLGLSMTPGLDEFILALHRYRLQSGEVRHHSNPYARFLGSDLSFFDRIYTMEELPDLTRDLEERTGQKVTLFSQKTDSTKVQLKDLGDAAFAALLRYTAADYALLRDYYTPPTRDAAGSH